MHKLENKIKGRNIVFSFKKFGPGFLNFKELIKLPFIAIKNILYQIK